MKKLILSLSISLIYSISTIYCMDKLPKPKLELPKPNLAIDSSIKKQTPPPTPQKKIIRPAEDNTNFNDKIPTCLRNPFAIASNLKHKTDSEIKQLKKEITILMKKYGKQPRLIVALNEIRKYENKLEDIKNKLNKLGINWQEELAEEPYKNPLATLELLLHQETTTMKQNNRKQSPKININKNL